MAVMATFAAMKGGAWHRLRREEDAERGAPALCGERPVGGPWPRQADMPPHPSQRCPTCERLAAAAGSEHRT